MPTVTDRPPRHTARPEWLVTRTPARCQGAVEVAPADTLEGAGTILAHWHDIHPAEWIDAHYRDDDGQYQHAIGLGPLPPECVPA